MKTSYEKILLLRVNDLNNKVQQLDNRVSIVVSLMECINIKIDEIHNEIHNEMFKKSPRFNNSPKFKKSPKFNNLPMFNNSPKKPRKNLKNNELKGLSKDESLYLTTTRYPCNAEYSYLGAYVPTFKAYRNKDSVLPDINTSKYTCMSRSSSNSTSS
jgi:hypothetical protein